MTTQAPLYVSVKDAAKMLSVSPSTINNWLATGILTRHKIGRLTRIEVAQLLAIPEKVQNAQAR